MPYMKLKVKQMLKSKFTWISLIAILVGCLSFWTKNYYASKSDSMELSTAKANVAIQKKNVIYFQKELKQKKLDEDNKKQIRKSLKSSQSDIAEKQKLITALQSKDWQKAYPIMIKEAKFWLADAKKNGSNSEAVAISKRDLLELQTLAKQHLPKEQTINPVKGGFFLIFVMEQFLPILVVLAVIFVLVKIFASDYFDRMRLGNLLPQNRLVSSEFSIGSLMGFCYFLVTFLLIFLIPSLFAGTGNFNYPIAGMNPVTKEYIFIPMHQLLLPILMLELLSFIFISGMVLFFVQFFKNPIIALLFSVLVLVGGMVIPQYIVAERSFAQFIPMSYFFALQPVNGMFGISNSYVIADETKLVTYPQVNFTNGVIVLLVGILILLLLNYFVAEKAQKGIKTS